MNGNLQSLEAVLADISSRLQEGATNRHSAMHMPVVGTPDGDMRIMVLRACDPGLTALRFHTDARSPKVATLASGATLGLLAFDPAARLQIRAKGRAVVDTGGEFADAAWRASTAFARRCYLCEAAPGTPVGSPTSGLPPEVEGIRPDERQLQPARANFAVVLVTLLELDWLHLAHDGHRRARFERSGAEQDWQGTWVVP